MCRGLLLFERGRPLGEHGLYWLKLQTANLWGQVWTTRTSLAFGHGVMSTAALPLKTIVYETKTVINSKKSLTKSACGDSAASCPRTVCRAASSGA